MCNIYYILYIYITTRGLICIGSYLPLEGATPLDYVLLLFRVDLATLGISYVSFAFHEHANACVQGDN